MTTIVEVPGMGEVEFPDSMSTDEISQALQKMMAEESTTVTRGDAFKRGFVDRSIETVLNTPAGAGELLAQAGSVVPAAFNAFTRGAGNLLEGQPADVLGEFQDSRADMLETFPLTALRQIPRAPEGIASDVFALNDATKTDFDPLQTERPTFSERLRRARAERRAQRQEVEQEFPGTFATGQTVSDVAAIVGGRAPLARARVPAIAARRQRIVAEAIEEANKMPPAARAKLNDVFSDKIVPFLKQIPGNLKNAGIKAGEAGLEGAVLAAINDGDIESTFGWAAGTQAASSAALFFGEKTIKHPAGALLTAWMASEMFKAIGPGDQDLFESKDFSIQKLVAVFGTSIVAALVGGGRIRNQAAERLPEFIDAVTAAPRTAVIARIQELTNSAESGNQVPLAVMQRLAVNRDYFNENQVNSLSRALNSDREDAFTREVNRLMNSSDDFRKRVQQLDIDTSALSTAAR